MEMKDHPNIGKYVKYYPQTIKEDKPAEGIIKMFEPAGNIFNQPMLAIDEVEHWIPASECKIIEILNETLKT
jgi:hypothetical protein